MEDAMARTRLANDTHPRQRGLPGQHDDDDRNDQHHGSHDDFDNWMDSHRGHGSSDRHDSHERLDVNVDIKAGGFNLDVNIDGHRNKFDIDIDIDRGRHGIDIKIDVDIDPRFLVPDSNPLAAFVGAEGNAVGHDTLVDVDIFNRATDMGSFTVAYGDAAVRSDAVSQDGTAFATALTFADISGADFVFVFYDTSSTSFSKRGVAYSEETSHTSYIAIDFDDFDIAGGPVVVDEFEIAASGSRSVFPRIDGNVATLDVDALAQGQDTLVDVQSSVLTVEDQISSISAIVVTAVA
jgi:hypothetical protein